MAANRRTPPRGARPRGARGPGRGPGSGSAARFGDRRPAAGTKPRPQITGRAAVLVIVMAVLAVSYASMLRPYLQQRDQMNALRAEIAQSKATIEEQKRELRRWDDDEYQRQQARERLGYVLPGTISFQTLDPDLQPLDSPDTLPEPSSGDRVPEAWFETEWKSVEAAGNPPEEETTKPAEHIGAPAE